MSAAQVSCLGVLVLCLFACSTVNSLSAGELSCKDEEGNSVDWFIAYKFPKVKRNRQFQSGYAYSYITSNDAKLDGPFGSLEADTEESGSDSFLSQFKDLLVRFAGGFSSQSKAGKKKASKAKQASEKSDKTKWTVAKHNINDPESIISRTLAPAYGSNSGDVNSIFYNDDPSGTDAQRVADENGLTGNLRRAHAKGVLLMNESSNEGVWLSHSVPRFPTVRKQPLEYPESGSKHGQTLICISFNLEKSGNQLVDHLYNMRPLVYDRQVSESLVERFPNLQFLDVEDNVKGRRFKVAPTLAQTVQTKAGQTVNLFSKSTSFDQDLWDGWIDHALGDDLYVQTWRNGPGGILNSTCPSTDFHVNNIKDLRFDESTSWSYLKDHSKWAISDREEMATVCIGDSNRMASQFKRGGGAVCIKCPSCWSVFSRTILDTEPCPVGSRRNKKSDKELVERMRSALHL